MSKKGLWIIVAILVVILLVGIMAAVFLQKNILLVNNEGSGAEEETQVSEGETDSIQEEEVIEEGQEVNTPPVSNEWETPRDEETQPVTEGTKDRVEKEDVEETKNHAEIDNAQETQDKEDEDKQGEGESNEPKEETGRDEPDPTLGEWIPDENETDRDHEHKGRYGYRRITTELNKRGIFLNHKTVQRLMRELGIQCRVRMKKYRSYKGEVGKTAPNHLKRNFYAEKQNQKWVTDVTEFHLFGQKLYLSPILDLCSRDIVSYTISEHPVLSMVTTMLKQAFTTIPDGTGLILHSDQGWQYQHKKYQRMLEQKGIIQSMSNKGNCLDTDLDLTGRLSVYFCDV